MNLIKSEHRLTVEQSENYADAVICNIKQGKGERSKYTYASIRRKDANGELLVNALLEYCVHRMQAVAIILAEK